MVDYASRDYWKPILKWSAEFQAAQLLVMAEESVWVPFDRLAAHCDIETGNTGDPKIVSRGVNNPRCSRPGIDCAKDGRAHGLFQIWWPPFSGVDWNRIYDPGYNSYLGARVLAVRYKGCGRDWKKASRAFFSGSCELSGITDVSTGTSVQEYDAGMRDRIRGLNALGYGSGGSENENPKSPKDGSENTKTDGSSCILKIPGTDFCLPSLPFSFDDVFPRIILYLAGLVVLAFGIKAVL